MAKIKIISNPYQKETVFQNWDEVSEQWCTIDAEYNENSRLLRDELRVGFFPFKAKQIIDVITNEYRTSGEKVEVIFEGTGDEYLELASICSLEDYSTLITLSKSGKYLENARDNSFITTHQIVEITSITTTQGASIALGRLMKAGLVEKVRKGKHFIYQLKK